MPTTTKPPRDVVARGLALVSQRSWLLIISPSLGNKANLISECGFDNTLWPGDTLWGGEREPIVETASRGSLVFGQERRRPAGVATELCGPGYGCCAEAIPHRVEHRIEPLAIVPVDRQLGLDAVGTAQLRE
jgi:hypothetical protein